MSRQVNFFITPDELPQIERALKGVGEFVTIADRSGDPRPKIISGLSDPLEPSLFLYLVRPQDLNAVRTRQIGGRGEWSIDGLRSPVIEFKKCYLDKTCLGRGRVYAQTSYFDAQDNLHHKDPEFLAWLDKLLRRLKRQLQKEEGSSFFYLSEGARALQTSGVTLRRV